MEESKNMSEAFRVYALHSVGSQFDRQRIEFPGEKKVMKDGLETERQP